MFRRLTGLLNEKSATHFKRTPSTLCPSLPTRGRHTVTRPVGRSTSGLVTIVLRSTFAASSDRQAFPTVNSSSIPSDLRVLLRRQKS